MTAAICTEAASSIPGGALTCWQALPEESYQVRLPAFEGPLDLLLQLIEREKLDISASRWPK